MAGLVPEPAASGSPRAPRRRGRKTSSDRWHGGAHPYTRYRMSAPLAVLPGAGEVEALGDEAREIFARLLARGLAVWPTATYEVTVSRPERRTDQQDPHRWPTPVSSYLRHGSWIPVEGTDDDEGERAFVRPSGAWLSVGGPLPRFVPPIIQSVRSVIGSGQALRQLRTLGIRIWDEAHYCGDILRQLPELLERGPRRAAPRGVLQEAMSASVGQPRQGSCAVALGRGRVHRSWW